ncbi:MAG: 30S ribosomal protein S13 [Candidatus Shikimatogenerans sp. Tder]|uniref:Small ribosomal subunit protein uS13 n=1 Tax=Candidatus Shikimatogenerans sp. Tder TaxID=3158566 RepID=A0AAU7QS82_9FLAO
MIRISGIILNENKKSYIALTKIFGIGKSIAIKILIKNKIDLNKKISKLKENNIINIQKYIDNKLIVEGDLRSNIKINIKNLKDINCYRGIRHKLNLPVRGQKTRNNSRTRKGKKKTIANKKKQIKNK